MRLPRSLAPVTVAVALTLCLPYEATPYARVAEPFGAECRTRVQGSHAIAYCHNPNAAMDRVRLHIECARWWDLDTDSAPVDTGPAVTVRLTGRCWKEVRSVWVSHQRP
ncbi:hypothetical protein GA0115233_11017 [Streptomyces sp. DI166]|uniref:hypothetical protein n=1 Tax=Streptomyces sp. DI166 TaxID=1839783 RepID=UPI0007F44CC2|nr:hypothetical protein [Streptomyces sp. DI166]SBT94740.1 hypothetical protein GA0115233_11017 [Streptomyces sp. DI166]